MAAHARLNNVLECGPFCVIMCEPLCDETNDLDFRHREDRTAWASTQSGQDHGYVLHLVAKNSKVFSCRQLRL